MNQTEKNDIIDDTHKTRNLYLGILFDLLGMVSFAIPMIGEFEDVVWAPVSGLLLAWMYKGKAGKIGGIFSFLEEIFPFTDVIPTFTAMWFYTYYFKKR